jgi:hypothetical protein
MFDSTGCGELYLASQDTGDQWVELLKFSAQSVGTSITEPIDITRWVRTGHHLRLKYRLKAERPLYHPTPDDPIGIAGAQCLRSSGNHPYASRLRLWRNKPND